MRFLLCLAIGVFAPAQPVARSAIVMSVWYNGPGTQPPSAPTPGVSEDVLRKDLAAIRTAGFNAITTWISWREGEPRRGVFEFTHLGRLVGLASEAGLGVQIEVDTDREPSWKTDGTNALSGQFWERVRADASRWPVVTDVRRATPVTMSDASRIRVGPGSAASPPRRARLEIWTAIANGRKQVSFLDEEGPLSPDLLAVSETVGVLTRNQALFAALRPRVLENLVRVQPGGGVVGHILESPDAILIVALNHSDRTRRVKLTFPPDLPEAIWQNMEAGNAVNFIVSADGPYYEHTFAPEDALVLAIRKRLR
jgi:hypothetical protein